jgi:hypothetical protein
MHIYIYIKIERWGGLHLGEDGPFAELEDVGFPERGEAIGGCAAAAGVGLGVGHAAAAATWGGGWRGRGAMSREDSLRSPPGQGGISPQHFPMHFLHFPV